MTGNITDAKTTCTGSAANEKSICAFSTTGARGTDPQPAQVEQGNASTYNDTPAAKRAKTRPHPHEGEHHTLMANDLTCGYKGKAVLSHVSLTVESGRITCLLGPNGVGKTTLFKTLLGFLPAIDGAITVDGENRASLSRKQFARKVSYVPQTHEPPFSYSVLDMVLTGCVSRLSTLESPHKKDYDRAVEVLDDLGIGHLAARSYTAISGGEQQMALIARALMQNARILMMDEPTAALDFGNQVAVLSCIKAMAGRGHGIIMTSHNPDHAFLCCTDAALITREGDIISGPVDDVVTEENLHRAYGIDVRITTADGPLGEPVKTCVPMLT